MNKTAPGFTLVELLVVIAIIALVSTLTLANFRPFGEDQVLKSALSDIESLLVQTQTYASTNTICSLKSGALWQAELRNSKNVAIVCTEPAGTPVEKKLLTLPTDIDIQTVSGSGIGCPSAFPFWISYTLLSGASYFESPDCTSLNITLVNYRTNSTKTLGIDKGGNIYVQ